jgi:hypothetical protein
MWILENRHAQRLPIDKTQDLLEVYLELGSTHVQVEQFHAITVSNGWVEIERQRIKLDLPCS